MLDRLPPTQIIDARGDPLRPICREDAELLLDSVPFRDRDKRLFAKAGVLAVLVEMDGPSREWAGCAVLLGAAQPPTHLLGIPVTVLPADHEVDIYCVAFGPERTVNESDDPLSLDVPPWHPRSVAVLRNVRPAESQESDSQ